MKCTELATGLAWPEGPSLLPDGRIVFVETYRSQVSYWAPGGEIGRFAYVGGGPNATLLGADGAVYVTQNGGVVGPWRAEEMRPPSIQRIDPSGKVEVVATEGDGRRFQAPNDFAFGPDGRLYFTDPGNFEPATRPDPGLLWTMDPDGTCHLLEELPPVYPNGIVVEQSGSIVWVESYTRAVRRRDPSGAIEVLVELPEGRVPDGLKVGSDGTLYITGGPAGGLDVVSPSGELGQFLQVGVNPTNCTFDASTLYVTDGGTTGETTDASFGGRLWAVELDGIRGMSTFPGAIRAEPVS